MDYGLKHSIYWEEGRRENQRVLAQRADSRRERTAGAPLLTSEARNEEERTAISSALIVVWAISRKGAKDATPIPPVFLAVLASLREPSLSETMINAISSFFSFLFVCALWIFVLCWPGLGEAQGDIRYATGFEVEDVETHRVVRVKKPWRDARETFEYVLIPRGAKPPEGYRPHQIFEVPVRGFVPMSTSFLPHADVLQVQDEILALSDFKYVNTPSIVALIEAGKVMAVGHGAGLDVETLVHLKPGLVMVNAFGNPQTDAHYRLEALGIQVVVNGEYMETHPLGRAEWLKFTALFFGKEEEAGRIFDGIVREYERLSALGQTVAHRPRVLTDTSWRGTWHVPGGGSFMAQFLSDAGADYIWKDDVSTGGLPLSFETVLARARDADFWINVGSWRSLAEALGADSRYSAFKAFQTGRVYNRDRRVNPHGGNDFWETAIIQPHNVLADLLKIFHPELLPDHELVWYRQLDPLR